MENKQSINRNNIDPLNKELQGIHAKLQDAWTPDDLDSQLRYAQYLAATKARIDSMLVDANNSSREELKSFMASVESKPQAFLYKDKREVACRSLSLIFELERISSTINLQTDLLDGAILVTKDAAYEYAIRAAKEEGIFAGISTGATLAAIAQKLSEIPQGATVLGLNYDTGERYLSIEGLYEA